jgi:hypothetical protein
MSDGTTGVYKRWGASIPLELPSRETLLLVSRVDYFLGIFRSMVQVLSSDCRELKECRKNVCLERGVTTSLRGRFNL